MEERVVRGAWALVLAATLTTAPVVRADDGAADHALGLRLEMVDLSGGRQFHLFPELVDLGGGDMARLGQLASEPSTNSPPGFDRPIPVTLTPVVTFDLAEPGKTELRLFRIDRKTWDDLDTWEKIGLVTSYASAVAGVVGLAMEVLD